MSKGKNISKGKKRSKSRSISKLGFAIQKEKIPKTLFAANMIVNGKMDEKIKARFTKKEIAIMKARAKKYNLVINENDVGSRISANEWDRIDSRINWDEYELVLKSGKKVRLLATMKESDKGISRVEPSWKSRKKKEKLVVSGQQRLFES